MENYKKPFISKVKNLKDDKRQVYKESLSNSGLYSFSYLFEFLKAVFHPSL